MSDSWLDDKECYLCGETGCVAVKKRRITLCEDCKDVDLHRVGYYGTDGNPNTATAVESWDVEKIKRIRKRAKENGKEWVEGLPLDPEDDT